MLFLSANPHFGALVARAIEFIVNQYKKVLEIRKLHGEIERLELPAEVSDRTKEHANELMGKEIEKFTVEIMAKYEAVSETGRRNELTTALNLSLNSIANRIDRGFNFEVRVEPPPKASGDGETAADVQVIQGAAISMQFMRLSGQPILQLRERNYDSTETSKPSKKPKTGKRSD